MTQTAFTAFWDKSADETMYEYQTFYPKVLKPSRAGKRGFFTKNIESYTSNLRKVRFICHENFETSATVQKIRNDLHFESRNILANFQKSNDFSFASYIHFFSKNQFHF